MIQKDIEDLKMEIAHIFDSGANEIRIEEMVKTFINQRYIAINHKRCSLKLPSKEEELLRLEKDVASIEKSNISLYKKEGYVNGYCDGFRIHSHWLENR